MRKYFLLIFLPIILFSCKKEPYHYRLTDNFLQWTYYIPGSCWVYQNDSSDLIYSVYIENISRVEHSCNSNEYTIESILTFTSSNLLKYTLSQAHLSQIFSVSDMDALIADREGNFIDPIEDYELISKDSALVHTRSVSGDEYNEYFIKKNVGIIKIIKKSSSQFSSWTCIRYKSYQ